MIDERTRDEGVGGDATALAQLTDGQVGDDVLVLGRPTVALPSRG